MGQSPRPVDENELAIPPFEHAKVIAEVRRLLTVVESTATDS